ncbi:putative RNA-dependent RNA polymerase [Freshwater macrophyte associated ourli-like virus 1]|nr:putative RNA-dependent RNA polymerase [Freshwater macrophyte associated ourli-like virus 1]
MSYGVGPTRIIHFGLSPHYVLKPDQKTKFDFSKIDFGHGFIPIERFFEKGAFQPLGWWHDSIIYKFLKLTNNRCTTITRNVDGTERDIFVDLDFLEILCKENKKEREFRKVFCYPSSEVNNNKLSKLVQSLSEIPSLSEEYITGLVIGKKKDGSLLKVHYCNDFRRFKHVLSFTNCIYQSLITSLKEKPFHHSVIYRKGKIVYRASRERNHFFLFLFNYYFSIFPKGKAEKDLIKIIKLSLVGKFAEIANQELPEGYPWNAFEILPPSCRNSIEGRMIKKFGRQGLLTLYFAFQQSKGLCEAVPEDFLRDGLIKHKKGICKPQEELVIKDEDLYQQLRTYSSEKFGKIIKELYDPFKTVIPNQSACIESSREKGGNYQYLLEKGDLFYRQTTYTNDYCNRMEPMVIGLFGPPGIGKTKLLNSLCEFLKSSVLRCSQNRKDLVYSRSCHVKHWDGYKHQPIVIMDDFGQNILNPVDIEEFQQLVSCNPYMLPMADLPSKGTYFNSPIILLTSNLCYGSNLFSLKENSCPLTDVESLWRRITIPILIISKDSPLIGRDQATLRPWLGPHQKSVLINCFNLASIVRSPYRDALREIKYNHNFQLPSASSELKYDDPTFCRNFSLTSLLVRYEESFSHLKDIYPLIKKTFFHRIHIHNEVLGIWNQKISQVSMGITHVQGEKDVNIFIDRGENNIPTSSLEVNFPLHPPERSPIVQGVPLAEPLKVRVITKAESSTRVLKPLQLAMWKSLESYPEFSLTSGCKDKNLKDCHDMQKLLANQIRIIYENSEDNSIWLSGDYDAATDNIPMWVTEALLEGILEHIDHEPTKEWARYEISPHRVLYPKSYNISEGFQTSGQLMGSLLSFPLLCMVNDFLCSKIAGFPSNTYRINGDDIVARVNLDKIDIWKSNAHKIGLKLSLGKNFIDEEFCTVNSQLFFNCNPLDTGKLSLIYRQDRPIGNNWRDFQKYYGYDSIFFDQFVKNNRHILQNTPSSLFIPTSHGGLGEFWVEHKNVISDSKGVSERLAKQVYCYRLCKKLLNFNDILAKLTNNRFSTYFLPRFNNQYPDSVGEYNDKILESLTSLFLPKTDRSFFKQSKVQKYESCLRVSEEDISNKELELFVNSKNYSKFFFKSICDNKEIKIRDLPPLSEWIINPYFSYSSVSQDFKETAIGKIGEILQNHVCSKNLRRENDITGALTFVNDTLMHMRFDPVSILDLHSQSEINDFVLELNIGQEEYLESLIDQIFDDAKPLQYDEIIPLNLTNILKSNLKIEVKDH